MVVTPDVSANVHDTSPPPCGPEFQSTDMLEVQMGGELGAFGGDNHRPTF